MLKADNVASAPVEVGLHTPVRRALQLVNSQVNSLHAQATHLAVSGGKEVDSGFGACAHHGKL